MANEENKQKTILESISFDEARAMVQNYRNTVGGGSGAGANEITTSVWFSLEHLKKIYVILETEKLLGKGTDGVRVYFAKYPNGENKDRNTVVLVSTFEEQVGKKTYHRDYFESIMKDGKGMLPENRGVLCPPEEGCDPTSDILK